MYNWKIRLDTLSDTNEFLFIASQIPEEIYIRSGKHLCTSAKSALGCHMARVEWNNLVCECEKDIYTKIQKFIVIDSPETEENW
jgi:hypothetical protein